MKSAFDAALNLLHPPPPEHEPELEFESQPGPAVEARDPGNRLRTAASQFRNSLFFHVMGVTFMT